jgi:hypothetical protein
MPVPDRKRVVLLSKLHKCCILCRNYMHCIAVAHFIKHTTSEIMVTTRYIDVQMCSTPPFSVILPVPSAPPRTVEPIEPVRNRCSVSLGCCTVRDVLDGYPSIALECSRYSPVTGEVIRLYQVPERNRSGSQVICV